MDTTKAFIVAALLCLTPSTSYASSDSDIVTIVIEGMFDFFTDVFNPSDEEDDDNEEESPDCNPSQEGDDNSDPKGGNSDSDCEDKETSL